MDQYNRKTIISVENYFPFVKTRIKVVKEETREIILTPIEVATEDIAAQLCKLRSAMNDRSVMLLHMVVQSCVATAVQAGPIEVAKVFLRSTFNCKYYKHYISALVLERKKYIQITRERSWDLYFRLSCHKYLWDFSSWRRWPELPRMTRWRSSTDFCQIGAIIQDMRSLNISRFFISVLLHWKGSYEKLLIFHKYSCAFTL